MAVVPLFQDQQVALRLLLDLTEQHSITCHKTCISRSTIVWISSL